MLATEFFKWFILDSFGKFLFKQKFCLEFEISEIRFIFTVRFGVEPDHRISSSKALLWLKIFIKLTFNRLRWDFSKNVHSESSAVLLCAYYFQPKLQLHIFAKHFFLNINENQLKFMMKFLKMFFSAVLTITLWAFLRIFVIFRFLKIPSNSFFFTSTVAVQKYI